MDDVVQDEPPTEREQDLEAIQAHMAMTMALAYEAIDASMKNSTLSDEHSHFHQSLADYRPRPPRLGVGAVRAITTNNNNNGNEGNVKTGMARETARLHGRLAGKKRRRDEEEGDEGEMEEKKTSGSSGTTTAARKQQHQGDGSSDEGESRAATISKTTTGSSLVDRFALPGMSKKKKKQKQEMEVAGAEGGLKTGEEAGKKTVEEEKEVHTHSDLDAVKEKKEEKGSVDEERSKGAMVSDTSKPPKGWDSGTCTNDTSVVPEASPSPSKKKKKDRKKEKKKEDKMDEAKPVEEGENEPSQAQADVPQTEATKEQGQQASRYNVYGIPSSTSSGSATDGSDARRTENAAGEMGVNPHPTNEIESSSRTTKEGPPSPLLLLSRISPEGGGIARSGIVSPLASRFKFGYYPSISPTRSAASSPSLSLSPPRQKALGLRSGLGSGGHGHVRSPSSESKTSSGRVRMMTQAEWKRLRLKREVLAARTWTVPTVVRSKVEEEEEPEAEELKEEGEGEEVGVKSKGNLTESVATAIQPSSKGTTTRTTPIATMMLDTPVVQLEPLPLPDPRVGDDLSHGDDQGEKKKRKKNRKHRNRKRKREEQGDGMVMEDAAGDEHPSREVDQGGEKGGEGDSDQE